MRQFIQSLKKKKKKASFQKFTRSQITQRASLEPTAFWPEIAEDLTYRFLIDGHRASGHFIFSILNFSTIQQRADKFFSGSEETINDWTISKFKSKEKKYRQLLFNCLCLDDDSLNSFITALVDEELQEQAIVTHIKKSLSSENRALQQLKDMATKIVELGKTGIHTDEIYEQIRATQISLALDEMRKIELIDYHKKIQNEALAIEQMSQQSIQKRERESVKIASLSRHQREGSTFWGKILFIWLPALFLTYCGIQWQENLEEYNHPACEKLGMKSTWDNKKCY